MRLPAALLLSSLALIALARAADPTPDELIANLSSEKFSVREEATAKLWALGDPVLEKLRAAANGDDPEAAFRAIRLIRKIEFHIAGDTDTAIVSLVERYQESSREERLEILAEIRNRRGWYQVLKLYANETDPIVRDAFNADAHAISVMAARERLIAGKPDEARKILELAPRDNQSLMTLAAFHRSQGSLDAELEKAKALPAAESAAWRTALHRAAGNITAARQAAAEAKDPLLTAALALFAGDPLPWLAYKTGNEDPNETRSFYLKTIASQWRKTEAPGLEPLLQMLGSRDGQERAMAASTFFLLGKPRLAEAVFTKTSPVAASSYFEATERLPEAFAALGLDPVKPDFTGWALERFERIIKEEDDGSRSEEELVRLAEMLGQLGLRKELHDAYEEPLLRLAAENEESFLSFIQTLFAEERGNKPPASIARDTAAKWAGHLPGRWRSLIQSAIEDDPMLEEWWDWMPELDPAADLPTRFEGLLGLIEFGPDPQKLNRHWLDLAWKAVEKAPAEQQPELLKRIGFMFDPSATRNRAGDIEASMKIWSRLEAKDRGDPLQNLSYLGLAVSGRWTEAAEIFESIIARDSRGGLSSARGFLHAYAASSLRRAGREKEAAAHDELVEKFALGDWATALQYAQGYAYGGDKARELKWIARAAIEADPGMSSLRLEDRALSYETLLRGYADRLLEDGNWQVSAALGEAVALEVAGSALGPEAAYLLTNLRLKADLPHALAILPTDRPRALAMLANCHAMFPAGGTLADDFFPSLRKAGLIKEHDEWFDASWKIFSRLIDSYPDSDRLRNGAAWLGSRATRKLDEAEKHAATALTLNPDQAAYLDTMAEVHFAERDRKAALKWSAQAVNFGASDPQIRRQYERFRTDPLPGD